jgi:hypothetical protein
MFGFNPAGEETNSVDKNPPVPIAKISPVLQISGRKSLNHKTGINAGRIKIYATFERPDGNFCTNSR